MENVKEFSTLSEAHKALPARLKELEDTHGKFEIRSVCFHRADPITGGNWFIRIRGHIKTQNGIKGLNA
jgi:hypothetical protein